MPIKDFFFVAFSLLFSLGILAVIFGTPVAIFVALVKYILS